MSKQTLNPVRAFATLAAAMAFIAFAGASHADETDPPKMRVSYADLNLSTPAGAQTLYRRLRIASKAVCSSFDENFRLRIEWNHCFDQAMRNAVLTVNSPLLSEIYGLPAIRAPQLAESVVRPAD